MSRKKRLLIGGLLFVCTFSFIISYWNVFFTEAKTILTYKSNSDVSVSEVIDVLPVNYASVNSNNGVINIELNGFDINQVGEIQAVLEKTFEDKIEFLQMEHLGESKKTPMFYGIGLFLIFVLIMSGRFLYLGIRNKNNEVKNI